MLDPSKTFVLSSNLNLSGGSAINYEVCFKPKDLPDGAMCLDTPPLSKISPAFNTHSCFTTTASANRASGCLRVLLVNIGIRWFCRVCPGVRT